MMKAVMARILGRAGSAGALRWAWAALNTRRTETAQRRNENRMVPRRMNSPMTGTPIVPQGGRKRAPTTAEMLHEGGDAGDTLADDELVDVVGAFVGGDAFEI